jgi:hypothetical protein
MLLTIETSRPQLLSPGTTMRANALLVVHWLAVARIGGQKRRCPEFRIARVAAHDATAATTFFVLLASGDGEKLDRLRFAASEPRPSVDKQAGTAPRVQMGRKS